MTAPTLGAVLVFAPDLGEARRFYGEVLGLSLERDEPGLLAFHGANFVLHVFPCEEATIPERYSRRAGVSVSFAVPSLARAMAELAARGVRFLHASPNEGPAGRYAAFVDPFGIVHELVELVPVGAGPGELG